jgi:hypothetical protein
LGRRGCARSGKAGENGHPFANRRSYRDPQLENLVGHKVKDGESFVDIVDNSAVVDVAIDAGDVGLLRSREKASLKLDGFPERTFPRAGGGGQSARHSAEF